MKAKISRGSGFRGLLDYLYGPGEKDQPGRAVECAGNVLANGDPEDLARQFKKSRELRPEVKKPVWHSSLSLPAGENLDSEQWQTIARDYMASMGMDPDNHQWHAVRHSDTDHDHIHIVASRIGMDGSLWYGKNDVHRAIRATQDLERRHGLQLTPGFDEANELADRPSGNEIHMAARTGEPSEKQTIKQVIDAAAEDNPSFSTFADRLEASGVYAIPSGKNGKPQGMSFCLEDGEPIKASAIGRAYSLGKLANRVDIDYDRDAERIDQLRQRWSEADSGPQGTVQATSDEIGQPRGREPHARTLELAFQYHEERREWVWKNRPDAKPPLKDHGDKITVHSRRESAAKAAVQALYDRYGDNINVWGSEQFRRNAWRAGRQMGISVSGYEPDDVDAEWLQSLGSETNQRNDREVPDERNQRNNQPNQVPSEPRGEPVRRGDTELAATELGVRDLQSRGLASHRLDGGTRSEDLLHSDERFNRQAAEDLQWVGGNRNQPRQHGGLSDGEGTTSEPDGPTKSDGPRFVAYASDGRYTQRAYQDRPGNERSAGATYRGRSSVERTNAYAAYAFDGSPEGTRQRPTERPGRGLQPDGGSSERADQQLSGRDGADKEVGEWSAEPMAKNQQTSGRDGERNDEEREPSDGPNTGNQRQRQANQGNERNNRDALGADEGEHKGSNNDHDNNDSLPEYGDAWRRISDLAAPAVAEKRRIENPDMGDVYGKTKSEYAKIKAWRTQHEALQAESYRLTAIPRNGGKPWNLGVSRGTNDDKKEHFFTADEVEQKIPQLAQKNAHGYDIFITPMSERKHYMLIDDTDSDKLKQLREKAGVQVSYAQESSPGNIQAVAICRRDDARPDEKARANEVIQTVNYEYGDTEVKDANQPFRMAGFTNRKPQYEEQYGQAPFVKQVVARGDGEPDPSISNMLDKAHELEAQKRQAEADRQAEIAAQREAEAEEQRQYQANIQHLNAQATPERDLSPDDENAVSAGPAFSAVRQQAERWAQQKGWPLDDSALDFQSAAILRKAGYSSDETQAAVSDLSPDVAHRKGKWVDDYARRTVAKADAALEQGEANQNYRSHRAFHDWRQSQGYADPDQAKASRSLRDKGLQERAEQQAQAAPEADKKENKRDHKRNRGMSL